MCGRFTLFAPNEDLAEAFRVTVPELPARYNIAPTQPVATVLVLTGDRQFKLMRWGLIPSWAKDMSISSRLINARAETVAEKPAFRSALQHRRCLILADGFFEWQVNEADRQPYYITKRDKKPFAFAGLWDHWQAPEGGEPIESCTIITVEANELIAAFHHRMPVILDEQDYDLWLDPEVHDPQAILPLLKPYPAEKMTADMVGKTVNSPAHEVPDCIRPVR